LRRRWASASVGFGSSFRSQRTFLIKPFDLVFEMQLAALQVEFIDLDQNRRVPRGRGTASGPRFFAMCSGRLFAVDPA
jgi:hypothetical protein